MLHLRHHKVANSNRLIVIMLHVVLHPHRRTLRLSLGDGCSNSRRSWSGRRSRGRQGTSDRTHARIHTRAVNWMIFGAALEPPLFSLPLLYVESIHTGHAGRAADTARTMLRHERRRSLLRTCSCPVASCAIPSTGCAQKKRKSKKKQ
jgi:hypothetical protein